MGLFCCLNCLSHLKNSLKFLGHLNQLFNHLRGFDCTVVILPKRFQQSVTVLLFLNHITARPCFDLVTKQFFQKLYR